MAEQLSFDLTARPALGREDFFVSDANALAVAMLDDWPRWPGGKMLLLGPPGAGKTHLAHVWARETDASLVDAEDLPAADIPGLSRAPVVVEDVQSISGLREAETQLFHLHNLVLASGQPLLLTGSGAPRSWPMTLPDLASRLEGTNAAQIEAPDEALLGALFMKLFADRQLAPQPDVVPYLARHAPRAFDAARGIVEDMDRRALQSGKRLTRDMARAILSERAHGD